MATKKKMLQAAAGAAGGGPPDITDVFSTYLYEGNGSTKTITNDIDLAGEGGLVWIKSRNLNNGSHYLFDTERGVTPSAGKFISTNNNNPESTTNNFGVSSFNSDGFSLLGGWSGVNGVHDHASWTFRKAPKFFDVVTYTGDGSTTKTVSHNLESTPAMIIFRRTDNTGHWVTWHKDTPLSGYTQPFLRLNGDFPPTSLGEYGNSLVPTSTFIRTPVHSNAGNSSDSVNVSGASYVAYLFAHNNGDGEFGPDADQDIIKCGSFTCDSSGAALVGPDLGFEPQWVLVKNVTSTASGGWWLFDSTRGFTVDGGGTAYLLANSNAQEYSFSGSTMNLTNTGFKMPSNAFAPGQTFIYMAIRRGPLAPPESATEVFDVQTFTGNGLTNRKINTGFVVDANITWGLNGKPACLAPRFINGMHEVSAPGFGYDSLPDWLDDDYNDGFIYPAVYSYNNATNVPFISYSWNRAPGFFDVVAYKGDGTANQTFSHGLAVKPDMVWIKNRDRTQDWWVGLDDSIFNLDGRLNDASDFGSNVMGTFTDTTVQTLNQNQYATNYSGDSYISYLFASLPGISKVGSYTGDGTTNGSKVIDCGFSNGARFVLLKKASGSGGEWYVFDTTRGIVSGNEGRLELNTTAAEAASDDFIDPASSGFAVNGHINQSNETYIFYAIA